VVDKGCDAPSNLKIYLHKKMWPTYHLHTSYCDGKNTVAEWAAVLRQNGVPAAGLSSHAPLPEALARPWAMKSSNLEAYFAEIRQAAATADKLQLYAGLEADYVAGFTAPGAFAHLADYTIGSIHILGLLADGTPWEVDMSTTLFKRGVQEIFDLDYCKAVCAYFGATRDMIGLSPPVLVGHLDKIKIHNRPDPLFDETAPWYREQVMETLHAIREKDLILEVNTRGLYQNKTDTAYPSRWILEEALRLNIRIALSSDAHRLEELHAWFAETAGWLEAMGYRELTVLKDGVWQPMPFTKSGLKWT
jgi:histidinol-phosphatase (PHP family)